MKPIKDYKQKMRRVLKKFKFMVKKYGSAGALLCMGTLSLNCGTVPPVVPLYGPIPVQDCYTDEDCVAKHGSNWYCDLNEATPTCKCSPMAVPLYGPPLPCTTDEQCQAENGADWYCDLSNTYQDNCGNIVSRPLCKQKPCQPVMLYGPQGCTTDADCQTRYGSDWYCDVTNAYDDGCGGTVSWPVCKQKCPPIAIPLYGPPPCGSDAACQAQYGADWYCDLGAFTNGCVGTWGACKQK